MTFHSILVVDDDPAFIESMRSALRAMGHSPLTASTMDEIEAILSQTTPDFAAVDLHIPGIEGGGSAVASFLASRMGWQNVAIVTGDPEGVVGFAVYPKPVTARELVAGIDSGEIPRRVVANITELLNEAAKSMGRAENILMVHEANK